MVVEGKICTKNFAGITQKPNEVEIAQKQNELKNYTSGFLCI